MRWPSWFNGNPLVPQAIPGPERGRHETPPDALIDVPDRGGYPLSALIPDIPHQLGELEQLGPNHQTGAQPERQAAVLAGHSVTGAYLLGEGLPLPPGVRPRLSASPELLFTMHPIQTQRQELGIGPVAPYMATGKAQ